MTLPFLYLAGGVVCLYFGADWLVRGAATLGRRAKVPSIVIGLTVVSIGTSAPELVVSVLAALRGSPDISVGNVLGSNLANVGLILGLAALMRPLEMTGSVLRRDIPWMLGVTLLVFPLMWNLRLGRVEGLILAAVLMAYLSVLAAAGMRRRRAVQSAEDAAEDAAEAEAARGGGGDLAALASRGAAGADDDATGLRAYLVPVAGIVIGTLTLVLGGRGVVSGATDLALMLGVAELTIGLSVVAIGTSLPELAAVVIAAVRKEADLAVGNIVGSNLFNLSFVLGATALVEPIAVQARVLRVEYPAVLLLSLVLLPLAISKRKVGRLEGLFLLLLYAGAWVWIRMWA